MNGVIKKSAAAADKRAKAFPSTFTVTDGERAVVAVISTAAVDRDGEVLVPMGCNSKDFEKNPVVYFNHDYWCDPIGQVVSLKREADAITAKVVFAERPKDYPEGQEWKPDTILSLFQQKVIRGFSVGFIPNESRPANDRDIEKYGAGCRRVFSKWTLLELSVAPLPANQEALAVAVSKGIISSETARKVFGEPPATKSDDPAASDAARVKSEMGTCDKCKKECDLSDLEDVEGEMICKDCRAKKAAEPRPEPAEPPVKRVATVITPADPSPGIVCRRIHHVIIVQPDGTPDDVYEREVKCVVQEIARVRGRIYVDNSPALCSV